MSLLKVKKKNPNVRFFSARVTLCKYIAANCYDSLSPLIPNSSLRLI